jgi:hypothetical protein
MTVGWQPPPPVSLRRLLVRMAVAAVIGATVGAALGAWAVRVRATQEEPVAVRVEVFGAVVAREVVPHAQDSGWLRWTDPARATAGALLVAFLAAVLTARASGALGYQTFRVVEAVRGATLGVLIGVLVCGLGFAVLGAVVSAMLEEPSWTLADALARGARLGGPFGTLLGGLVGMVLGIITGLSGATRRYHALRSPPT